MTADANADTAARDGADASHVARSGAVQVLTVVAQGLLGLLPVVVARLFGQTIYGSYQAALNVMEVFCRGGAAGADKAVLRYVASARTTGDSAGVRSAIGTALRLQTVVGGAFAIGLAFLAPWLAPWFASSLAPILKSPIENGALASALRILAPLPLLTGALWILMQASLAARVTRANFYVRGLLEPVLLLAAGVSAWAIGAGLHGLVASHLLAYGVTLIAAVWAVRKILLRAETHRLWSAPWLPGFARFSLPLGAAELLNAIAQRANMVILYALGGPEMGALFGAAEVLTRPIGSIRSAFDSIVAGVLSETLSQRDLPRLRYNLILTTRWVVTVAAPIALTVAVLGRDLLGTFFDSHYVDAAAAMLLLALGQFINASLGLTGWVIMVAGRSTLSLIDNLIAAIFNLVAGYFLIKHFGILGAAVATLATTLLLQLIIIVQVAVLEHVHPFSLGLWKPILAAALLFGAEWATSSAMTSVWLRVPAVIVVGAAVYVLGLWILRLPAEEKQSFERIVRIFR